MLMTQKEVEPGSYESAFRLIEEQASKLSKETKELRETLGVKELCRMPYFMPQCISIVRTRKGTGMRPLFIVCSFQRSRLPDRSYVWNRMRVLVDTPIPYQTALKAARETNVTLAAPTLEKIKEGSPVLFSHFKSFVDSSLWDFLYPE